MGDERIGKQKATLDAASKLSSRTRFTPEECRALLYMHQKISLLGKLDRLRLREIMHSTFFVTDDVILDRVFRVLDKDNDGVISDSEWVEGLSIICRGSPEQLIDFCYTVYDINGDKSLAREELHAFLKGSVIPYAGVLGHDEVEEAIYEIVDLGMQKLDPDGDGQITLPDFTSACYADPLILQAIGPCLPPASALAAFFALFIEDYRSYSTEWNDEWRLQQAKIEMGEYALREGEVIHFNKNNLAPMKIPSRSDRNRRKTNKRRSLTKSLNLKNVQSKTKSK